MEKPKPPTIHTLRKYGLTEKAWRRIAKRQKWVCPICLKPLADQGRKLAIDHHHVPGWKKMKPEQRRRHVRGILHSFCNRTYVRSFMTIEKIERIVVYLRSHRKRLLKVLRKNVRIIPCKNTTSSSRTPKVSILPETVGPKRITVTALR